MVVLEEGPVRLFVDALGEHQEWPVGEVVVDDAVVVLVADAFADLEGEAFGFDGDEAAAEEPVEVGAHEQAVVDAVGPCPA